MKMHLPYAAFFALSACAAAGGTDDGQGHHMAAGGGAGGQGATGGAPASGRGAAGQAPIGGTGGQSSGAGMSGAAGSSGRAGSAGTLAMAGTTASGQGGAAASAGQGGTPPAAGTTGGGATGTVTIEFTTATYGGRYAPFNYGAVWFESASGDFIKTAKRWAGTIHAGDLATWTEASGGWSIFGGGNMADMMDAMSSATLRTHQMHSVTWGMKGTDGQVVPDGPYVAVVEMTEDRAADRKGPVVRIPFMKGPAPQMIEAPAVETITGVVLRYQP